MPDGSWLGLVGGLSTGRHAIGGGSARRPGARSRGSRWTTTRSPGRSSPARSNSRSSARRWPCGLRPPLDAACSAPTQVTYRYRTTGGAFAVLADTDRASGRPRADDGVDGRTVDYIVRLERGTIDRAIYEVAALSRPGRAAEPVHGGAGLERAGDRTRSAAAATSATTRASARQHAHRPLPRARVRGRLVEPERARQQLQRRDLGRGRADGQGNLIETYGVARYTIGWGGSGGAIQQQLIANNYPGILDGIVPSISFPDGSTLSTVPDCRLLARWLGSPEAVALGLDGGAALGRVGLRDVQLVQPLAPRLREPHERAGAVTCRRSRVAFLYNPVTNPGGIRCTSVSSGRTRSAATRRTASSGGGSTTSASHTGSPRSRLGRSHRSSSCRSTSAWAATT